MISERVKEITEIGLDRVAAAAGNSPNILRLENLDTDIPIPGVSLQETQRSIADDDSNSWLPLTGRKELRNAVSKRLAIQCGQKYDPDTQIVITCGGMEGLLDSLLAVVDPGDEVIVTDPTYAGMINRVRLAGATPVFVPFRLVAAEWRLDLERLEQAASPRTKAIFIMNPSMPSGAVLNKQEWQKIADLCLQKNLWLIYNAAMEKILFDGRDYFHPATLDGMANRTITVGSASKEFRMIGWKVGWVAGSAEVMEAIARVHVYNTADPVGIAQMAVATALEAPEQQSGVQSAIDEWERRRDCIVEEMKDMPIIPAAGGWSMLLDVGKMGFKSVEASEKLLKNGNIAATYMRDWGHENSDQFVRFVFSNEPVFRLKGIGDRVRRALL